MDEALIAELIDLLRSPRLRRDGVRAAVQLPRISELATAAVAGSLTEAQRIERLLHAAAARTEPAYLRRSLLAYWGLPPFAGLDSAVQRQQKTAEVWAEDFAALPRDIRTAATVRPAAANTLRGLSHKRYFAQSLAAGVEAVIEEAGRERRIGYVAETDRSQRARPKLPVVATLKTSTTMWIDDRGRKVRTRYENTGQAMAPTTGLRRLLITDGWKGYRAEVAGLEGCTLLSEEPLNNGMRRVTLQLPAQQVGEVHRHVFELRMHYDESAPAPDGGDLFSDEVSDDFEAHLVVHFGARQPSLAWYFDDLPRPLVPGEAIPDRLLGLDPQGRLTRNFFPPTNARKCYGIAWRFEASEFRR